MTKLAGSERAKTMANRIRKGATMGEVALEFGISRQRVAQILRYFGYDEGSHEWRRRQAADTRAFAGGGANVLYEVIAARELGATWREIANRFGAKNEAAAMASIRYHCLNRGLPWPIERKIRE